MGGIKACKIKWGGGGMTNESYIIVGFCQSILMNLSFHKKKLGGQAPQLTMGATPMAKDALPQGPPKFYH